MYLPVNRDIQHGVGRNKLILGLGVLSDRVVTTFFVRSFNLANTLAILKLVVNHIPYGHGFSIGIVTPIHQRNVSLGWATVLDGFALFVTLHSRYKRNDPTRHRKLILSPFRFRGFK